MADYVASQTVSLDDQISAGAAAATASLGRLADASDAAAASADGVTVSVTKAGASAAALAGRFDPATNSANKLAAAQALLTNTVATMTAAVDSGSVSQAQADAVITSLTGKVRAAQAAVDQFSASSDQASGMAATFASSQDGLSAAAAKATTYQQALNAALGVSASTPDGYAARAADIAAYGSALDATRAKFDPVFAVSKQYEATLEEISIAEKNGALSTAGASAARDAATASFARAAAVGNDLTDSVNKTTGAHAGLYREIVILGHEVISGNFSRIPGSLVVLAERSGQLETIFQTVVSTVTSLPGILAIVATAGVGAFAYMAISADNFIKQNIQLQNTLQATRDDYAQMSVEAQSAARLATLQTPGLSKTDATAAAGTLAANPAFTGNTQQLAALVTLAAQMGDAFKETADKAATDLAAAMDAPGQAADRLVGHLRGMTQALADSIAAQADAGDKAGAFARYQDVVSAAVDGTTTRLSPLQQGLHDISAAFNESSDSQHNFAESLGAALDRLVAKALEAFAAILNGLKAIRDWDAQYLPWADGYGKAATAGSAGTGTVSDTINSVGAGLNAPAGVIALAQRIAPIESSSGQYDDRGNVVTSSTGALGAMQVEPGNANGNDLTTLTGNVTASEQLLTTYYEKYHGDERLVAMAYNWGPARVDAFLAGTGQAPPASVQSYATQAAGGGSTSSDGVTNSPTSVVNQALEASSGSAGAQLDALEAKAKLLKSALDELSTEGVDPSSKEFVKLSTELNATVLSMSNMAEPAYKAAQQLDLSTAAQDRLTAAYGQGYGAVQEATAANAAQAEAMQTAGVKSTSYAAVVDILTQKHLALAEATAKTSLAEQTLSNGDQLQYLQAETASLGTNSDARDTMLAHLKAEQDLRAKGIDQLSAEGQAYLASVDAISAQSAALAKSQSVMSDLENTASQAFDQIGSAITNAFTQGGKSAIDFGAIAKQVLGTVLDEALKLAVLNPVLNSLFGTNKSTLGDVGGLLGKLFGGSDSTGVASDGSTVAVQTIASQTIGGDGGATGGLVQIGDSSSSAGAGIAGSLGGVTSSIGSIGSGLGSAIGGIGAGVGSVIGAGGIGLAVGTTVDGAIGGNPLGSDIGGIVGGAIGALLGPVGALVGSFLGSLVGGLFGNSKPSDKFATATTKFASGDTTTGGTPVGSSEYSATNNTTASNLAKGIYGGVEAISLGFGTPIDSLAVNDKVGSRDGVWANIGTGPHFTGADTTAGLDSVANETIKYYVSSLGSKLDSTAGTILKEIDYTNANASTQVSALASALTNGKLDATQTSALPYINLSNVDSATSDLSFIKNDYEPATTSSETGSLGTQIAAVITQFAALAAKAASLGLSTQALTDAQNAQVSAIAVAAADALNVADVTNITTGQKAQAQIDSYSSDPSVVAAGTALAENADLAQFDTQETSTVDQFSAQLIATYGGAYKTTAAYAKDMADLEQSLATQRLDIQAQYAAQAKAQQNTAEQAASGVIVSLTSYIASLQTSTGSPLNAKSQYSLARSQYAAVSSAAQAGDANSIGEIQSYATAFLTASQNLYGSGASYASDFSSVLTALQAISALPADTLTASFFAAELQSQTDTLNASLAANQAALAAIALELKQQNARAA